MAFREETLRPGFACWGDGCHVQDQPGDCPECGAALGRVAELWVFYCSCGGWTFVNAAVAVAERDRDHPNAVSCSRCGQETGWFSPP